VVELVERLVRGLEDLFFLRLRDWHGVVIGAHLSMFERGGVKMLLGRR